MRVSYYAGRGPVSTPVMVGRLCANPIETPYAPLLVTPRRNAIVCMGAKRMASLLGGHLLKGVGYFRRVTRHKDPPRARKGGFSSVRSCANVWHGNGRVLDKEQRVDPERSGNQHSGICRLVSQISPNCWSSQNSGVIATAWPKGDMSKPP